MPPPPPAHPRRRPLHRARRDARPRGRLRDGSAAAPSQPAQPPLAKPIIFNACIVIPFLLSSPSHVRRSNGYGDQMGMPMAESSQTKSVGATFPDEACKAVWPTILARGQATLIYLILVRCTGKRRTFRSALPASTTGPAADRTRKVESDSCSADVIPKIWPLHMIRCRRMKRETVKDSRGFGRPTFDQGLTRSRFVASTCVS